MALTFLVPPTLGGARAGARAALLSESLSSIAGLAVSVQVASDYADLRARVEASEAAMLWAPGAVCAQIASHVRCLFRVVRAGRSTYRAALIARKGAFAGLHALEGAHAAAVDRLSLASYVMPRRSLRLHRLDPEAAIARWSFVGSFQAALAEVMQGRADLAAIPVGGGTPGEIAAALERFAGAEALARLEAIGVTDPVPADAIVFTRALPEAQAKRLVRRLFSSEMGGKGPAALSLMVEGDAFERGDANEYLELAAELD
ncbi:MAG: phosphate/phosphite/phosphonate ABC transporter substrate-binding protein [Myxococcales bacterium]|nr:phosphate/phosphite/phosphonate ABC transporter substrate-binding protein [Myxococcales bacterium]